MSNSPPERPVPGNDLILSGVGIGAIGVAGVVLLGAACPVCVVATPALIGVGLIQRWRARRITAAFDAVDPRRDQSAPPGPDRTSGRA
jgi:hypothetical protein